MSASIQSDSAGNTHYMLPQEYKTSCAMACCAMAYAEYNQICVTDPEGAMRQVSKLFPGAWKKSTGTKMQNLPPLLSAMGVKNNGLTELKGKDALVKGLAEGVKSTKPAILAVTWAGSGGHAVLCVDVRGSGKDTIFVFRDPWFGVQEVGFGTMPTYSPGCSLYVNCSKSDAKGLGTFSGMVLFTC